jgi:hypothetical protein
MTPLERAVEAFCRKTCMQDEPDENGCGIITAGVEAALLSLATPEAIPDAAVEAFLNAFFEEGSDVKVEDFPCAAFALAAFLRAIAEGK